MVDKKITDEKIIKKSAAKNGTRTTVAGKKDTVAKSNSESDAESIVKPVVRSAVDKDALVTIEKAGASKDAEMKAAAKKISELDKLSADDAIESRKSADELKKRAHEPKQRAQQKILEKGYVSDKPIDQLERLANTFDNSARRWELVVYPSLLAFVLLAGYGFFLIYKLTHDIHSLSQSVTKMAVIVSDAMPRMTRDMGNMTGSMDNMTGNIAGMSTEISSMSGQMNALTPMSNNIQSMTHNIGSMNRSVYGMQRDMHGMNRTVSSGPFGMMNDVMPFNSNTNVPPDMPPPQVWPSYNTPPQYQQYPPRTTTPVRQAVKESIKKK